MSMMAWDLGTRAFCDEHKMDFRAKSRKGENKFKKSDGFLENCIYENG